MAEKYSQLQRLEKSHHALRKMPIGQKNKRVPFSNQLTRNSGLSMDVKACV